MVDEPRHRARTSDGVYAPQFQRLGLTSGDDDRDPSATPSHARPTTAGPSSDAPGPPDGPPVVPAGSGGAGGSSEPPGGPPGMPSGSPSDSTDPVADVERLLQALLGLVNDIVDAASQAGESIRSARPARPAPPADDGDTPRPSGSGPRPTSEASASSDGGRVDDVTPVLHDLFTEISERGWRSASDTSAPRPINALRRYNDPTQEVLDLIAQGPMGALADVLSQLMSPGLSDGEAGEIGRLCNAIAEGLDQIRAIERAWLGAVAATAARAAGFDDEDAILAGRIVVSVVTLPLEASLSSLALALRVVGACLGNELPSLEERMLALGITDTQRAPDPSYDVTHLRSCETLGVRENDDFVRWLRDIGVLGDGPTQDRSLEIWAVLVGGALDTQQIFGGLRWVIHGRGQRISGPDTAGRDQGLMPSISPSGPSQDDAGATARPETQLVADPEIEEQRLAHIETTRQRPPRMIHMAVDADLSEQAELPSPPLPLRTPDPHRGKVQPSTPSRGDGATRRPPSRSHKPAEPAQPRNPESGQAVPGDPRPADAPPRQPDAAPPRLEDVEEGPRIDDAAPETEGERLHRLGSATTSPNRSATEHRTAPKQTPARGVQAAIKAAQRQRRLRTSNINAPPPPTKPTGGLPMDKPTGGLPMDKPTGGLPMDKPARGDRDPGIDGPERDGDFDLGP